MAKKKVPLTMEQHKEVGRLIRESRLNIFEAVNLVGPAYTTKLADKLIKAIRELNYVKSLLEDEMFVEHRDIAYGSPEEREAMRIYYGDSDVVKGRNL